jgi:pimeloyl-ACP methyl ester carboxylesterase
MGFRPPRTSSAPSCPSSRTSSTWSPPTCQASASRAHRRGPRSRTRSTISPVGLRLATRHPERAAAIISQNGNAYLDGLSPAWEPIQAYWREPTPTHRAALKGFLTPEATKQQYVHGVADETLVAPESYTLDSALLARAENDEIQLDLFLDYQSNVALYPRFQEYLRAHRPPLLAVWGRNDPFFLPAGAEAYRRDQPAAEVHLYDTGHFALETHAVEIAAAIREFLTRRA